MARRAGGRRASPGSGIPPAEALRRVRGGEVAPLYLILGSGAEAEDLLSALVAACCPPPFGPLNRWQAAEDAGLPEVLEQASSPPLGGGRRLVIARNPTWLATPPSQALLDYCSHPPLTGCLVVTADADATVHAAVVEAFRLWGLVVDAVPATARDAADWVRREAAAAGIGITPAAVRLLLFRAGHDRTVLRQEVRKLATFCGDAPVIDAPDVEAVVPASGEETVFHLVDAAVAGDVGRALALLRGLRRRGEPPLGVLALLARQVRLVWHARCLLATGVRRTELSRALNVHPFVAEKAAAQARLYDDRTLLDALEACLQADLAIKSGTLEPDVALDLLLLRLRPPGERRVKDGEKGP
ncbi:MAG: DNA polymerase III subunit delta [Clostridia bacterium]|nr:DNA polymerase III subunit delta [Clostridia bacterium]